VDGVLREAEVEQLRRRRPGWPHAVRCQHHVAGLEITVDDAVTVRGVKRLRDLHRDADRVRERQRAARQALGERLAHDVLHHEIQHRLS
jgi:hypothetical protein